MLSVSLFCKIFENHLTKITTTSPRATELIYDERTGPIIVWVMNLYSDPYASAQKTRNSVTDALEPRIHMGQILLQIQWGVVIGRSGIT